MLRSPCLAVGEGGLKGLLKKGSTLLTADTQASRMYENIFHQPLTLVTLRVPEVIIRRHCRDVEKPQASSEAEAVR